MQVNISHRLIKKMIENGHIFINDYGVYSPNMPKGVYATKIFSAGDIIRKLEGQLVLQPTRESIHIGNGMHVIDDYGQYINHSFEPNAKIEINKIVAIKDIQKYDEITFNYNETEIDMANPFEIDGIKVCGKTTK